MLHRIGLRRARSWTAGLASLLVVAAVSVAAPASQAGPPDPSGAAPSGAAGVERQVHAELAAGGSTDFWVYLRESADLAAAAGIEDRAAQGRYVYQQLTRTAAGSQAGLRAMLDAAGAAYQPFWIANTIKVTGDAALLDRIAARPEVAQITADRSYPLVTPIRGGDGASVDVVEWGIAAIQADQVWSVFGVRGEGIVVGSIDTGVQHTHPALVRQYRGTRSGGTFDHNYNWHDPSQVCGSPSLVPCDNNGHGTHTTGTMVGDDGAGNQIGVAPRAKWMAAKGCESASCSQTALLSSGQFMLAPTDLTGANPRPALRPHVVNNSWGGGANADPWYQPTVQAWVAAGIFPQFAAGNGGFGGCATAANPGNLPESHAAGAFDINGNIAGFSARGPSAFGGIVKPDLAAPGVDVRSSVPGGYQELTGTSMASPHTAGTVALMWSAAVGLERNVPTTRRILAVTAVDMTDLQCGGTPEFNNVWGHGKLNAFAAVRLARQVPAGRLGGTVTKAGIGAPIAGATVTVTGPVDRQLTTNSQGKYGVALPGGHYRVAAVAPGCIRQATRVVVTPGQSTVQDFRLTCLSPTATPAP